jgi:hypothetical protein
MGKENLLLIDTSADYCHSDKINDVFRDKIHDCDGFEVINRNEKSWTATRVGITAVKAWAYGTGKPIFENGREMSPYELTPYYNSEFKVTTKKN